MFKISKKSLICANLFVLIEKNTNIKHFNEKEINFLVILIFLIWVALKATVPGFFSMSEFICFLGMSRIRFTQYIYFEHVGLQVEQQTLLLEECRLSRIGPSSCNHPCSLRPSCRVLVLNIKREKN